MSRSRNNSDSDSNYSSTTIARDSNGELIWPSELASGVDIWERTAIVQAARYFEAQRHQGGEGFILPHGVHGETTRLSNAFNIRYPGVARDDRLYDLICLGHTGQAMQNVAARTQQSSSSRIAAPAQTATRPNEEVLKALEVSAKIVRNIATQEETLRQQFQAKYPGTLESDTSGVIGDGIRGLAAMRVVRTTIYPPLTTHNLHMHHLATTIINPKPSPAPHEYGFSGVPTSVRHAYKSLFGNGPSSSPQDVHNSTQPANDSSHRQQVQAHIGGERAGMAENKAIIHGKPIAISAPNETESTPSVVPETHAAPEPRVGEPSAKKQRPNPSTSVNGSGNIEHHTPESPTRSK